MAPRIRHRARDLDERATFGEETFAQHRADGLHLTCRIVLRVARRPPTST